jgi:hypothetical protein
LAFDASLSHSRRCRQAVGLIAGARGKKERGNGSKGKSELKGPQGTSRREKEDWKTTNGSMWLSGVEIEESRVVDDSIIAIDQKRE